MTNPHDVPRIAAEVFATLNAGRQIPPFSARLSAFGLHDAYGVTAAVRRLREARGEQAVGRKIGFTNRAIWTDAHPPMWGYVYDRTVHDLSDISSVFPLAGLAEPRIEPEIVFGLATAPVRGMDERALLSCVKWVAHGFEVVQSIFPGWVFSAPDAVAAFGLHGALLIGRRHPIAAPAEDWSRRLSDFEIDLKMGAAVLARGLSSNVLGGPLSALRHFVDILARDSVNPPLAAGEIVTTGTLTRVLPVAPGQAWTSELRGVALDPITVSFV